MTTPIRTSLIAFSGMLLAALFTHSLPATENGGSVYPVGAETVLPGLTPAAGQTDLYEFTAFYQANGLMNAQGKTELPRFNLGIEAAALKLAHGWGIKFLGGNLVSTLAVPWEFVTLTTPAGTLQKTGIGNSAIGAAYLAYHNGNLAWWYGMDTWTPGFAYAKGSPLNIGEHYWASTPTGAFTWLPDQSRAEISSRFSYFFNYQDAATQYHSGNEFIWEFDTMRAIKRISVGVNGYFYKQTTGDTLAGLPMNHGNFGRDMAIGPELRGALGKFPLIVKYQRDTLVENKPRGNMFWFQMGVPLGHPQEK